MPRGAPFAALSSGESRSERQRDADLAQGCAFGGSRPVCVRVELGSIRNSEDSTDGGGASHLPPHGLWGVEAGRRMLRAGLSPILWLSHRRGTAIQYLWTTLP